MVRVNAKFKLTGWNAPQLKLRVAAVLTAYGKALDQQFKEEIQLPQFPWPNPTRRSNGAIVGSPRNIVDTGAFLASQRRERPDATTLRFTWGGEGGVTYAGRILTGEGARWGADGPPRNWIALALQKQPLDQFFAAEWRRLAQRGA